MGAISIYLAASGEAGPGVVDAMAAASPHRGSQVQVLTHGGCALAVNVPDEAPDVAVGRFGDLAVAFVGSLDNAADLGRDLGLDANTSNDLPALVVAGYRAYGDDLPSRMRGVFAGAVTDGRTVLAFRDHIGYRPLFYRLDATGFYAATEAKQVVAGAAIPREPDVDVVERIVYRNVDDHTPSALRGVRRLPKSTAIWSDGASTRMHRYWRPEALIETGARSPSELKSEFDRLLDQAVTRCLTGQDVLSLSGGIDSPGLAAFAAPRHVERFGRPLHALTVVYPDHPSVDERRYVEPLAEQLGMPLHLYEQESNALADLDRWVRLTDSPYRAAAMPHYEEDYLKARALGFTTVLSGEHAEFVYGMQWFLVDHYVTHSRWASVRHELAARREMGRSWVSLIRLLARSVAPDSVMAARNAFGRHASTTPAWIDRRLVAADGSVSPRERWRRLQLTGFIGPGISLEAEEVCQAVTGVRSRKPWTDVDLWEFFLKLPAEQKFPDLRPKSLVRNLLRGRVPDFILDRQDKTVFDEAGLAHIDYSTLRRYLVKPRHHIRGVNYGELGRRLDAQDFGTIEYGWARNLANAHAFLDQW